MVTSRAIPIVVLCAAVAVCACTPPRAPAPVEFRGGASRHMAGAPAVSAASGPAADPVRFEDMGPAAAAAMTAARAAPGAIASAIETATLPPPAHGGPSSEDDDSPNPAGSVASGALSAAQFAAAQAAAQAAAASASQAASLGAAAAGTAVSAPFAGLNLTTDGLGERLMAPPPAPAGAPATLAAQMPVDPPVPNIVTSVPDAARTITVGPGESLYTISERHAVSLRALIDANGLTAPFTLSNGQVLSLPVPNSHTVGSGETLFAIAQRYRVDLNSLAVMNGLSPPYPLQVGQPVYLPALATDWGASAAPAVASAPSATPPAGPRTVRSQPAPTRPAARPAAVTGPRPDFGWPGRGNVVSRFGEAGGAVRNDGVNIAMRQGAPVSAAADGLVVYAGDELRGYGNLVLVKHADGWVSAYAHLSDISVGMEQTVRAGDVIARAGSTGAVDTPQLHFELRHKGRPVDPLAHLPQVAG